MPVHSVESVLSCVSSIDAQCLVAPLACGSVQVTQTSWMPAEGSPTTCVANVIDSPSADGVATVPLIDGGAASAGVLSP